MVQQSDPQNTVVSKDTSTQDVEELQKRRFELLKLNLAAWVEAPVQKANLDSNFKKNTAFIKKCKISLNSDNLSSMIKEIQSLTLEKYISEVVAALSEGLLKCKTSLNVLAAVEIVSALHQRFPKTFSPELFESFRKMLSTNDIKASSGLTGADKEKEDYSRILRQRTIIRVSTEIWLSGVFWGIENGIVQKLPEATQNLKQLLDILREGKEPGDLFYDSQISNNPSSINTNLRNNRLGLIYHSLKALLGIDRSTFVSSSLAVSFLKSFGTDILKINPKDNETIEGSESNKKDSSTPIESRNLELKLTNGSESIPSIINKDHVDNFQELFFAYYKDLSKNLVREHKAIKREEKINQERYIARGEINDETKARYEANFKAYEKHLQSLQTMSQFLNLDMPDLPKDSHDSIIGSVVINEFGFARGDGENVHEGGPWEDEDARVFYEKLLDLKSLVPGILLGVDGSAEHKEEENDKQEEISLTSPEDKEAVIEQIEFSEDAKDEDDPIEQLAHEEDDQEEHSEEKTTASAQMTAFLARLLTMGNRDLIDQAAVDFCYFNNKASRKRLIQNLIQVPSKRLDLLSYYSRLIATLNPYFPDIGLAVHSGLEKEFRFLLRKKISNLVESSLLERRIKNIRYLAELTKFHLLPLHFAFFILKTLLDLFNNPGNVEVLSNYLEVCGRFLLKTPETSERTGAMIDIMMKKKISSHLNERLEMMIENAFYQCNPPDQSAIVKKTLTPMQQFIKKLLLEDLTRFPLDKGLRIFRKLQWDQEDIYNYILKKTTKVHKNKFSHLQRVAALIGGLVKYQPEFIIDVVDQVLEDIRVGLEDNLYKFNQKRIAQVKFLAELYNYRVIDSPIIFDTLYSIITFGYEHGRPFKGVLCSMDLPDDYFRIRLCCTILDACGSSFDRGKAKIRLDEFLVLFQLYIQTKGAVPMDIQFAISDTFELIRPNLTLHTNYEDAENAIQELIKTKSQSMNVNGHHNGVKEDSNEVHESEDDNEDTDSEDEGSELSDAVKDDDNQDDSYSEEEDIIDDENHDQVVLVNQLKKEEDEAQRLAEEEEFEKEFQQMMASTAESRKLERKVGILDMPIPMKLLDKRNLPELEDNGTKVAFSLLTKRGNKQQVRTMAIPSDSSLAIQTLNKQKAERVEQQHLKSIVLGYEESQDAEAERQFERDLEMKGFRVLHTKPKPKPTYNSGPSANAHLSSQHQDSDVIQASDFNLKSRSTPNHKPKAHSISSSHERALHSKIPSVHEHPNPPRVSRDATGRPVATDRFDLSDLIQPSRGRGRGRGRGRARG